MAKVKFGVFSDLHVDIMHDTKERLEEFLDACRKEEVDFIIQLGDFCYPDENRKCISKYDKMPVNIKNALSVPTYADKDSIISLYRNFEKPAYHVLGNHDCDMCSKEMILNYYGVDYGGYYSFDMGGFHFVVLDPNYMNVDGIAVSYDFGSYFDYAYDKPQPFPYLPEEQLRWLEEDLSKTTNPTVLFSHQRLYKDRNYDRLREIMAKAPGKVVMALNGHEHLDSLDKKDGVWFYNVNSMSCFWVDAGFIVENRYTPEIDAKYPNIKYTIPYDKAVYAIVTLDENGASVTGSKCGFVGPDPEEMDLYGEKSYFRGYKNTPVTAGVQDRYLPFD